MMTKVKSGRPKVPVEMFRGKIVTVRISRKLFLEIKKLSAMRKQTMSTFVSSILEELVKSKDS